MYIFIPYLGIPLSRLLTDQLFALHSWPVNNDIYNIIQHLLNLLWLNDWQLNIPAIEKRRITRHNHFKVQWSRYWDKSMGWERGGFHMGTISLTSGTKKKVTLWCDMSVWHNSTWHEMTRHDMTWHDRTWHDMTWQDIMQHHTMWYGTWHGMKDTMWHDNTIWCNMTWHNASQHEMTWHNMMQNHYITCHDMNWHHKKTIQQEVKSTIFVKEAITWINLTEIIQNM